MYLRLVPLGSDPYAVWSGGEQGVEVTPSIGYTPYCTVHCYHGTHHWNPPTVPHHALHSFMNLRQREREYCQD